MGQLIEVSTVAMGEVALFDADRSITGQDGHSYQGSTDESGPPALLANRLFAADSEISHVHVLSNTVSVQRAGGWPAEELKTAEEIVRQLFVFYDPDTDPYDSLREQHYNATLASIRVHNEDLWVMTVKPDQPLDPFRAGQYTTLALGYWEPRDDEADEELDVEKEEKLARRSYSVSSSIIDLESGELLPADPEEVEFYIVKVRPGQEEIPALTPRIFLKSEGDRIFMSRKFTGRYTLDDVTKDDNIVFLSTGTGEAPQNKMTGELLRNGHQGRILNLVCVRYHSDLAYVDEQAAVAQKFGNYKYEVLTTREPDDLDNKRYLQDLLLAGTVEEMLEAPIDPENTHFFLCGNPAMIGLPTWDGDTPTFPQPTGVCEILAERGFTIDHLKHRGNVHYEEYWKDRD
jgi:ferredoxin/flavodoxin---NADP+ reductase